MRRLFLPLLLATVAACSSNEVERSASANSAVAASGRLRGAEPATSRSAKDARAVVLRYFALVKDGDYAAARRMWGHDGADAGGSAVDFAAVFRPYTSYDPVVGSPSDIRVAGGKQFATVETALRVTLRRNGEILNQEGVVMLRRSADSDAAAERDWVIWGTDLRVRH